MTQFDEHLDDKLPNKLTHANVLLNAIECKDPDLNVSIAMAKVNKGPTRKMNKF